MKFLFALICCVGGFRVFAESPSPGQISVGFSPSIEAPVELRAANKLTQELSKQLGIVVKPVVTKNQTELIELLSQKKVDFAFLSSRVFVEVENKYGVKVLLKKVREGSFYYSIIFVNKKSAFRKVSDLKGHRLAFVDKKSGSGYLYPKVQLKKMGLQEKDFKEIVFSGGHPESVALLEQGKVDAIAVFSDDLEGTKSAWQKFQKENKIKVRKLWSSEAIPNDPFCVRKEFYDQQPKLTHNLMFTLIDVVEGLQNDSDVKSLMSANGFQLATSRQYDAVREMVQILGPVEE